MPTPTLIKDIVRARASVNIDVFEAVRIAREAAGRDPEAQVSVRGYDARTGAVTHIVMTVAELLTPPRHETAE